MIKYLRNIFVKNIQFESKSIVSCVLNATDEILTDKCNYNLIKLLAEDNFSTVMNYIVECNPQAINFLKAVFEKNTPNNYILSRIF